MLSGIRRHPSRVLAKALALCALAAGVVGTIVPLYWLFSAAFQSEGALAYPPKLLPTGFSLDALVTVVAETPFVHTYLANSLLVSVATVVLTLGVATPAGYALSRFSLPYERGILLALLLAQLVPLLSVVVPLYRVYAGLGLVDTLAGIVLANAALVVPVATWLIKGYFDTVPDALEEAARVAGATRLRTFRILVPLARPALGAAAIYAFVVSWNQFVIPFTFATRQSTWTVPVGLYEFISRRGVVQWDLLGAASLVAMVPVLVLFVLFQRSFVVGLMGSRRGRRR